jgi:hypothetical protein
MLILSSRSLLSSLPPNGLFVFVVSAPARNGRSRRCPGSGARGVSHYRERRAGSDSLANCEKRASGDVPDQTVDTGRDRACACPDRQLPL